MEYEKWKMEHDYTANWEDQNNDEEDRLDSHGGFRRVTPHARDASAAFTGRGGAKYRSRKNSPLGHHLPRQLGRAARLRPDRRERHLRIHLRPGRRQLLADRRQLHSSPGPSVGGLRRTVAQRRSDQPRARNSQGFAGRIHEIEPADEGDLPGDG